MGEPGTYLWRGSKEGAMACCQMWAATSRWRRLRKQGMGEPAMYFWKGPHAAVWRAARLRQPPHLNGCTGTQCLTGP